MGRVSSTNGEEGGVYYRVLAWKSETKAPLRRPCVKGSKTLRVLRRYEVMSLIGMNWLGIEFSEGLSLNKLINLNAGKFSWLAEEL